MQTNPEIWLADDIRTQQVQIATARLWSIALPCSVIVIAGSSATDITIPGGGSRKVSFVGIERELTR